MIDLFESDDQLQIVDSLRGFLTRSLPVSRLRSGGPAPDAWTELAELGVFGVSVAEDFGGTALGLADEALVYRELGRAAVSPSVLATWLALRALLTDGGDVEALITGQARACFALPLDGATWRLLDHEAATLAVGIDGAGIRVFTIAATRAEPVAALDWTFPVANCSANALALRNSVLDETLAASFDVVVGAMLTGLAEGARDLAVAYAKVREQFGQPIGGFQAIKHKCADMEVRCTAAWSQVLFAALSLDAGDPSGSYNRHAARALAADAAIDNAEAGIQIHGGIGFTAECDAHIFLKRARAIDRFGASGKDHLTSLLKLDAPGPERRTDRMLI